jgi:aspartyl protease family protein
MEKAMNRMRHCIACLPLFLCAVPALATDVNVVGLFPGKAVVSINGGEPRTLREGQKTDEGVVLVTSERGSATFEIDGKRRVLGMGQVYQTARGARSAEQAVTLSADARGHFLVDGQVNGASMRFLVDTGATWVALSTADAVRLAIDYRKGQPNLMSTANGVAAAYRVKLDSVRVGDITMNNVDAVVMDGAGPGIALLGMSFLNRMEMRRTGETMVLIKKY